MTVIVTGASGFVGLNLIERLVKEGHEVKALDFSPLENNSHSVQWHKCDVTKKDQLEDIISSDVEFVYHLAGVVGVKNYLANPYGVIDVNFESTRHLAQLARKYDYSILFASTSEIYGKNPHVPWKEEDDRVLGSTHKMRWVYSTSKALSEHLLFAESETNGLRNIIVRFFNLYGKYQKPINVVPKMITSLINGNPLALYDGGDQTRCFTYIDDAVDALYKLQNTLAIKNEAFNIGSNVETKIKQLSLLVLELFGKDENFIENIETTKTLGENYEDIMRRVPDVSKIEQMIGWKATTELDVGLKNTIDWYSENKSWWTNYI